MHPAHFRLPIPLFVLLLSSLGQFGCGAAGSAEPEDGPGGCREGASRCNALVRQTCSADGIWLDAETCESGCSAGACTGGACELGTLRCDGRVPLVCGEDGWNQGATCAFACIEGQCTGVCEPGRARCEGRVPQSCSAAGEWVGGEPCEFACGGGACTGVCVPGEHRCASGTSVETCDATGTWQRSACAQLCSPQTDACACAPGYDGDGVDCEPIDFCRAPHGGCSPRATCTQVGTTPSCACNVGTIGDGFSCAYEPVRVFDEGFDDIRRLTAPNWLLANRSTPVGITSWFQENLQTPGPFNSFDGAANSFIAANFNNTSGSDGTISSWLASPPVPFGARASISFYTRSSSGAERWADRIEVRLCTEMPCDVPNDPDVGNYTTLLGSVNPTLVADGYPDVWTKFEFTNANGIPYSGEGRVAIRYYVTEAGHEGVNSDYIGVDRFVGAVSTPSYTVGGWVGGLNGSVVLWLNGSEQLTVAANGSFRFPRRMDGGTPYSVRIYAQPAGQLCTVAAAAGTIGTADVDDIQVACERSR